MVRRALATGAVLAALVLAAAGCGGGSDESSSVPTVTAPTAPTGATGKTAKKKPAKQASKSSAPAAATPAGEKKCGKVFFAGVGQQVEVTAAGLPCPTALTYAKKFVAGEQPQQSNLPPGWNINDCTGINRAAPTPGEPNSPRCHKGKQVFTIHIPQNG